MLDIREGTHTHTRARVWILHIIDNTGSGRVEYRNVDRKGHLACKCLETRARDHARCDLIVNRGVSPKWMAVIIPSVQVFLYDPLLARQVKS